MFRFIDAIIQQVRWGPKKSFPVWKEVTFNLDQSLRYADQPFVINSLAWKLLVRLGGLHYRPVRYRLVKITISDLGQARKLINNKKLLACARYHGLLPCPPQLAVAIGCAAVDEDPVLDCTLATEPLRFKDADHFGYYLRFKEQRGKLLLAISPDKGPTMSWVSNSEHLFVLPLV